MINIKEGLGRDNKYLYEGDDEEPKENFENIS